MRQFGLIGLPLSHSFSKKYFGNKFEEENIQHCEYELYPLKSIGSFPHLLSNHPDIVGINVTIPYKEAVIPFLDELDEASAKIGAVNTIKIKDGKTKGYNTDTYGFEQSLLAFLKKNASAKPSEALILGTGGASKAVAFVLEQQHIPYKYVSRTASKDRLGYPDLIGRLSDFQLIVNTTPLGTFPNVDQAADLPYGEINREHLLYDLVYNPEKTLFLKSGEAQGAAIHNGLEMLRLQAEKSWEIWNE